MNDGRTPLSRRQRECLRGVANHLDSQQIAQQLGLSPHTVDGHIAAAMKALSARTRREAVTILERIEGGQSLTGQFPPVHNANEPTADRTNGVHEATSAFEIEPLAVRENDDADDVASPPLQTIALVFAITVALAVVLLAIPSLVEGAKNLANLIQPYF